MMLRTILAALFLQTAAVAQAQSASLTLTLQDSSLFIAELNGVSYSDPSNTMNVSRLTPGQQNLKVIKLMQMGNSVVKKPVFEGSIDLPAGKNTVAYIDQYNQFKISNTAPVEKQQSTSRQNTSPYFVPNPTIIKPYTQTKTSNQGMNNNQFAGQIETLKSIEQEGQRYQTAKGYVSLGTYNSNQIAAMILTLDKEQNRIRLADLGEQYTVDKENYGVVFNALRRPSSIRKLNRRLN